MQMILTRKGRTSSRLGPTRGSCQQGAFALGSSQVAVRAQRATLRGHSLVLVADPLLRPRERIPNHHLYLTPALFKLDEDKFDKNVRSDQHGKSSSKSIKHGV